MRPGLEPGPRGGKETCHDEAINRDLRGRFTALLPAGSVCKIEGGNHAGFGDCGPQAGDGVATITADEQQELAVQAVTEAMLKERT